MKELIVQAYNQSIEYLERSGQYICFEYLGASVGFYSDEPQAARELSRRFAGYFSVTANKKPRVMVYGSQNTALFDLLYSAIAGEISNDKDYTELPLDATHSLVFDSEVHKGERKQRICYVLDRAQCATLISYVGEEKNRRALSQRVIRNLIRLQLLEQGWLPLHGAALEKDSAGLCIVGGKYSGKTSTLINLLSYPGASLVATTKFFLRDAGDAIEVCGLPHKAGIRVGTVLAHPLLQRWISEAHDSIYEQITLEELREIAATASQEELKERPEKLSLMPMEIARLFNASIKRTTMLRAFISVRFEPGGYRAHLEPMEGDKALFSIVEHFRLPAYERQSFLRTFFTFTDEMLFERLASTLTKYMSTITIYALSQNAYTNAESEALLAKLTRPMSSRKEMVLV